MSPLLSKGISNCWTLGSQGISYPTSSLDFRSWTTWESVRWFSSLLPWRQCFFRVLVVRGWDWHWYWSGRTRKAVVHSPWITISVINSSCTKQAASATARTMVIFDEHTSLCWETSSDCIKLWVATESNKPSMSLPPRLMLICGKARKWLVVAIDGRPYCVSCKVRKSEPLLP